MKPPQPHSVVELDDGLLLVHKPQGHAEALHAHDYPQTLHVLRGRLAVSFADGSTVILAPGSCPCRIPRGCSHATVADEPTWLVVERAGNPHQRE